MSPTGWARMLEEWPRPRRKNGLDWLTKDGWLLPVEYLLLKVINDRNVTTNHLCSNSQSLPNGSILLSYSHPNETLSSWQHSLTGSDWSSSKRWVNTDERPWTLTRVQSLAPCPWLAAGQDVESVTSTIWPKTSPILSSSSPSIVHSFPHGINQERKWKLMEKERIIHYWSLIPFHPCSIWEQGIRVPNGNDNERMWPITMD